MTFNLYRSNEYDIAAQTYQCKRLIHGWPLHDLALAYCAPDAHGMGPGDKFGYLDFELRPPVIGDRLWLIPGHCDPTVNLHDWYVGVRNGRVEALWPIAARGASS